MNRKGMVCSECIDGYGASITSTKFRCSDALILANMGLQYTALDRNIYALTFFRNISGISAIIPCSTGIICLRRLSSAIEKASQ
jgi:hypothetical protein